MPQDHTLQSPTRLAASQPASRPSVQPGIQAESSHMTTKFLRIFAGIWIVAGSLASLSVLFSLIVAFSGNVRPNDGTGETLIYSAIVAMTSWTAGLTMCWMANLSDDLRAQAGR